jgi:hypothetical protein
VLIHSEINHTPAHLDRHRSLRSRLGVPVGIDLLESLRVTQYVAVSRDEPADFSGNWIVAVALGVSDVPAIDVYTCSGFEGDIVDTMYAAVTEDRYVSFLIDSLANLLNLG